MFLLGMVVIGGLIKLNLLVSFPNDFFLVVFFSQERPICSSMNSRRGNGLLMLGNFLLHRSKVEATQ